MSDCVAYYSCASAMTVTVAIAIAIAIFHSMVINLNLHRHALDAFDAFYDFIICSSFCPRSLACFDRYDSVDGVSGLNSTPFM